MGFRRVAGAAAAVFRPSLPWGFAAGSMTFAAGSGSILGVAACHRSCRSRSSSSSRTQEEKVATIIFSLGFRRVAGAEQQQQQEETGGKSS